MIEPGRSLRMLITACLGLALMGATVEGMRPRQLIEETADQVLVILRDPDKTKDQRIALLEDIAYERFDFTTMSRLVLGRNWKKLSTEQQPEFVEQFTQYLANDYGKRIDRFDDQEIIFLGEREEPRGDVTVMTKIVDQASGDSEIDYRMRRGDDGWRIIDVVIEGISLVANFRDQFREVLSREGPAGLLERLREKNAANAGSGGTLAGSSAADARTSETVSSGVAK